MSEISKKFSVNKVTKYGRDRVLTLIKNEAN